MAENKKTYRVLLTLDQELYNIIKEQAGIKYMSVNNFLRMVIGSYIAKVKSGKK